MSSPVYGSQRHKYPEPTPEAMARACRKLARDLWHEAAWGWPDVSMANEAPITRAEAARRLEASAERWERLAVEEAK